MRVKKLVSSVDEVVKRMMDEFDVYSISFFLQELGAESGPLS